MSERILINREDYEKFVSAERGTPLIELFPHGISFLFDNNDQVIGFDSGLHNGCQTTVRFAESIYGHKNNLPKSDEIK